MFDKRDVALAIRKLRGPRTQKEVADAAGVDRPTWNQYEKARAMPKRTNFDKVADGLGVTSRQLDEAIIEAWRQRLDNEPGELPEQVGAANGRPSGGAHEALAEGAGDDAFERAVRHHSEAVGRHLGALVLTLRNELSR